MPFFAPFSVFFARKLAGAIALLETSIGLLSDGKYKIRLSNLLIGDIVI